MKVMLRATCSECYQMTEMVLTEKMGEIVCPTCGHSVPALEQKAMVALAKDQGKRRKFMALSLVAFVLAAALFVGFILGAEPPAGESFQGFNAKATGFLVGSILMLLASLGLGAVASSRAYVCEF